METGERVPSRQYVRWMREVPGLADAVRQLGALDGGDGPDGWPAGGASPAEVASAVEFVLEGLHLQRRLNKERAGSGVVYRR